MSPRVLDDALLQVQLHVPSTPQQIEEAIAAAADVAGWGIQDVEAWLFRSFRFSDRVPYNSHHIAQLMSICGVCRTCSQSCAPGASL